MPRCYMSCLGTSPYVECIYVAPDGRESPVVRFVQEATIRLFCENWTNADRILIFTTQEAFQKNWLDDGHKDGQPGLESRLKALSLAPQVQKVEIPEGKTIEEIWQIFQILYDQLQDEDQVICDITHAFRSLPVLVLAVLGYARVMKKIIPEGIYYGAFEVLGIPAQVKNVPMEQRRAPLFDLTPFAVLLDWTTAIDRFLAAGDASLAQELANKEVRPLLRNSQGQDQAARAIERIARTLQKLAQSLRTCRGPELPRIVQALRQSLADCPRPDLIPPFAPLLQRLSDKIQAYEQGSPHPFLVAARWCADHNLIQQGFTILQEGLITHLVETVLQGDPRDQTQRDLINQSLKIRKNRLEQKDWHEPARSHSHLVTQLIKVWDTTPALAGIFDQLLQTRNDLNHAGYRQNQISANSFAPRLADLIQRAAALLGDTHAP